MLLEAFSGEDTSRDSCSPAKGSPSSPLQYNSPSPRPCTSNEPQHTNSQHSAPQISSHDFAEKMSGHKAENHIKMNDKDFDGDSSSGSSPPSKKISSDSHGQNKEHLVVSHSKPNVSSESAFISVQSPSKGAEFVLNLETCTVMSQSLNFSNIFSGNSSPSSAFNSPEKEACTPRENISSSKSLEKSSEMSIKVSNSSVSSFNKVKREVN